VRKAPAGNGRCTSLKCRMRRLMRRTVTGRGGCKGRGAGLRLEAAARSAIMARMKDVMAAVRAWDAGGTGQRRGDFFWRRPAFVARRRARLVVIEKGEVAGAVSWAAWRTTCGSICWACCAEKVRRRMVHYGAPLTRRWRWG
jgi:hypothetical protein